MGVRLRQAAVLPRDPRGARLRPGRVLDAVVRYGVDGAHSTTTYYPGGDPDEETFAEHSDGGDQSRTGAVNVNLLVKEMHERIHEQKPWVRFGASDPTTPRATRTLGHQRLGVLRHDLPDSLTWVREGWVISSTRRWRRSSATDRDYETTEVMGQCRQHRRRPYRRAATRRPTAPSPTPPNWATTWTSPPIEQVDGNVSSAPSACATARGFVEDLVERHYEHPALVPVIDSIPGQAPEEPTLISVQRTGTGVLLRWTGRGTDATSYAIWRLESEQAREKDLADRRNLVATMRDDGPGLQEFVHDGADGSGWYVVTAYDRTWRQSDPSDAQEARG